MLWVRIQFTEDEEKFLIQNDSTREGNELFHRHLNDSTSNVELKELTSCSRSNAYRLIVMNVFQWHMHRKFIADGFFSLSHHACILCTQTSGLLPTRKIHFREMISNHWKSD